MANDKKIQAAKKLRKALQIALSAVELEPDDVAELSGVWDSFDPTQKYKKGMIVESNGVAYICLKTVKSGADPATDAEHWARVGSSTGTEGGGETTEPTDPDAGEGGGTETPTVPEYDPEQTYNKGDEVMFGGVKYTCNKNNVTGVEPGSDSKSWIQAE